MTEIGNRQRFFDLIRPETCWVYVPFRSASAEIVGKERMTIK